MSKVTRLLATAREAHTRYRAASGRIGTKGMVVQRADLLTCGQAIQVALSARVEADAIDPQRSDPAWAEDERQMKATHDALVDFYVKYLTPRR